MKAQKWRPVQTGLQWLISLGLPDERTAAARLQQRTIVLHPLCGWRFVVAVGTAATAITIAYAHHNTALVTAILGVGALAIAYVEWVLARRETSLDRFYEKLAFANARRNEVEGVEGMSALELYIFSELDNLEYVIERYRFGYMSPALTLRAVQTFENRLTHDWFRNRAEKLLGLPGRCGYSKHTCDAFDCLICQTVERSSLKSATSDPRALRPGDASSDADNSLASTNMRKQRVKTARARRGNRQVRD
jgi:hypothetical protein